MKLNISNKDLLSNACNNSYYFFIRLGISFVYEFSRTLSTNSVLALLEIEYDKIDLSYKSKVAHIYTFLLTSYLNSVISVNIFCLGTVDENSLFRIFSALYFAELLIYLFFSA